MGGAIGGSCSRSHAVLPELHCRQPEARARHLIAQVHLEQGDWRQTKAAVLERNALQARSASTAKRLESELRQRLQTLTQGQLELLARGTSDDRTAMSWLRLEQLLEGVTAPQRYKSAAHKLQRYLGSDFEDF